MAQKNRKNKNGFTLVEALVGAAVFMLLATSVYQAFSATMNVIRLSRVKITATALANEQLEIMRNLSYADIGIVGGLPLGKIPATQTLTRDNKVFTVKTTIRNIDDPFDGTIGGTPNDTSPADYKLAEIEINCATCRNFPPLFVTTNIAPKNLESASTNGALFIHVLNSSGQPIPEAEIHIENNETIPSFEINDVTNNDGLLQIVDAPPGNQTYEISVSKQGYTSERTYEIGDPANPTPEKPSATVLTQQLTETSFIIDQASTINVSSIATTCQAVPNISFSLKGTKIIGTSPTIYKYNASSTTDGTGEFIIEGLDTDTYDVSFIDSNYILAGIIPSPTLSLNPNQNQNLKLIVAPVASSSILFYINDTTTGLPLSEAIVKLTGTNYDTTLTTSSSTDCLAGGQVFFTGLNAGNYNLNIEKTGYQTYSSPITISGNWQQRTFSLIQ
jgi:type II secretory pathway pseudopilin PulG